MEEYIMKIKNLADSLTVVGQIITDEELILYILGGLRSQFEVVVVNLTSRHDNLTLQEAQFMLQT